MGSRRFDDLMGFHGFVRNMRVWIYARTSGEEADTGQDVKAQIADARERAPRMFPGFEVVGDSADDGVSGDEDPWKRRGFLMALRACGGFPAIPAEADGIVVVEASRFSRAPPWEACGFLAKLIGLGIPLISLAEGHMDTREDIRLIGEEKVAAEKARRAPKSVWMTDRWALRMMTFLMSWSELVKLRSRTQLAMDAIKAGTRVTKSGKLPGRPKKFLPPEEMEKVRAWKAEGWGERKIALELSRLRGAFEVADPKVRRKRMVARSTVRRVLENEGRGSES